MPSLKVKGKGTPPQTERSDKVRMSDKRKGTDPCQFWACGLGSFLFFPPRAASLSPREPKMFERWVRKFVQYDPRGIEILYRYSATWLTLTVISWVCSFSEVGLVARQLRKLAVGESFRMPAGLTIVRREQ